MSDVNMTFTSPHSSPTTSQYVLGYFYTRNCLGGSTYKVIQVGKAAHVNDAASTNPAVTTGS